jgi:hypothetical protein
VEVKDAGSGEMVYYRDTNGEWTPEKGEVSTFLDWASEGLLRGGELMELRLMSL